MMHTKTGSSATGFQLNLEELDEQDSKAAELAWEFSKRMRLGEKPLKAAYYRRLQNCGDREEFDLLLALNDFIEHAVDVEAGKGE